MMLSVVFGIERGFRALVWVLLAVSWVRLAIFALAGPAALSPKDGASRMTTGLPYASGPVARLAIPAG